jgi:hypothetical protein
MIPTTKPEIWPTDRPCVVFMVPAERSIEYGAIMQRITGRVIEDLHWSPLYMELIGLISSSPQHGTDGIFFLEDIGIDTRKVTLLMLWGDTAKSVHFENDVPEECGVGTVILPATGVLIPTVRMPNIDGDWWTDPLHQEYAITVFASLVRDIRTELDGSEPFVFVTGHHTWN